MISRLCQIAAVAVAAAAAVVPAAAAAPPPKIKAAAGPVACGLRAMPMAEGNVWTYRSGTQQVQIKIGALGQGKDLAGRAVTTIAAEETFGARIIKTTYTCTGGGVTFPPDSFLFSGEPGGGVGETLTVTAREQVSLLADGGLVADANWIETFKANVERPDTGGAGAVHAPAKIEVELHIQVHPAGTVAVPIAQFPGALKVAFELRGRGLVNEQKVEIPIKRPGAFYIVKGIGIVKVEDAFDKTWQLVDTNVIVAK